MISRFKRKKPANYELKCQEINCENTWYVSFQLNRENTIFPESGDEDLKDVFGLAVTIVTNIKDKKETKVFLTNLGFPFKKENTK